MLNVVDGNRRSPNAAGKIRKWSNLQSNDVYSEAGDVTNVKRIIVKLSFEHEQIIDRTAVAGTGTVNILWYSRNARIAFLLLQQERRIV